MIALLMPLVMCLAPDMGMHDSPALQHLKFEATERGYAEYYTYPDNDWIFWRWKDVLKLKVVKEWDDERR